MATATTTRTLRCVIVTPERALLDEAADFVALPLFDGEIGILPGRAPLVGRLGFGELRIRRGLETKHYYVDGGFVQVRADVVTVLTARALPVESIDTTAAQRTLESQPGAALLDADRMKAQAKARVQLRLAGKR